MHLDSSPEDLLFREQFNKDLQIANSKCDEIKYKIKSLGNLSAPSPTVVREIVKECTNITDKTGFLFFLLAFGITPHPTRGKIKMYDSIYPWQCVASINFLSATQFISKKNRQTGATSFTSIYFLWRSLFFSNSFSFILSLGARESSDVLARVTFIYENLPSWLKTPLLEGAKTSITFKNSSRVVALPGTPEALRGRSSSAVLLDEFAFLKESGRILSAAIPSLSMGFLTPFSNNSLPSQLFIISTLPLVDSESNEYLRIYRSSLQGDSDFKVIYIPPDGIPEYQDPHWHKSMLEALGQKRYNVEILGILNSSLDNSFLPEHILSNLKAVQPIRTDFLKPENVDEEGYARDMSSFINSREHYDKSIGYIKGFWVWRDPLPGRVYGVSVDVSAGVGGDYSAIQIIDIVDGMQVAEFYSNRVPLEDFKFIIEDVAKYYNDALLSIERNSIGASLCSYFYEGINYEGFYIHRHSKNNYQPGFPLTSGNKGNLLAALQKLFMQNYFKINSIRSINELRNFGFDKRGSIIGLNGVHDDLVLSLAQYSYLKEIFFVSDQLSDWDDDFLKNVEAEEERIRNKHFSSIDSISRGQEIESFLKGYSVSQNELEEWRKNNKNLF
jgi:hypothetical protein